MLEPDAFAVAVSIDSLLRRAKHQEESPLQSDFLKSVAEDANEVVIEAEQMFAAMAKKMVKLAEKKLRDHKSEGDAAFGSLKEVLEHGCGKWSWSVPRNTNFSELVKVGESTLLKQGHAEKVAAFVAACKEDPHRVTSTLLRRPPTPEFTPFKQLRDRETSQCFVSICVLLYNLFAASAI